MDYVKLQRSVTKVMKSVKQGTIELSQPDGDTPSDPNKPWLPNTTEDTSVTVNAVAFSVDMKLVNGDSIVAEDLQITLGHPGFEITMSHRVRIDGLWFRMKEVHRIPEAGTAAAWELIVGK